MKYLKEVNKKYKFILMILEAIILNVGVYFLDKSDMPRAIINDYPEYTKYAVIALIVVAIIVAILIKVWKLIANKGTSYFDKLLLLALITELISIYDINHFYQSWKIVLYVILAITLIFVIIRFICYKENTSKIKSKK